MNRRIALVLSTSAMVLGCDHSPSVAPERDSTRTEPAGTTGRSPALSAAPSAPGSPAISGPGTPNRNALFLSMFRSQLPENLCKPGQYFRACFRVSEARCREVAIEELDKCVARHRTSLPLVLDGTSGAKAGRVLGQCAGTAYDIRLAAERIQSAKCNTPSAWTDK